MTACFVCGTQLADDAKVLFRVRHLAGAGDRRRPTRRRPPRPPPLWQGEPG